MAQRIQVNLADKASLNPVVSGLALTNELANCAFPESSSKRWTFPLSLPAGTVSAGNVQSEVFIGGTPNFRFRPADTSTAHVNIIMTYTCSVTASCSSHTLNFTMLNRAGVVTFLPDNTNTKMPAAVAAAVGVAVVANQLTVLCNGVAGDAQGRWNGRMTVTEVTDMQ